MLNKCLITTRKNIIFHIGIRINIDNIGNVSAFIFDGLGLFICKGVLSYG